MKEVYIIPTYINSYVDSANYSNPIQYYISAMAVQTSDEISKKVTFNFLKNMYSSDNGYLLEDIIKEEYVSLENMLTDVNSSKIQKDTINMLFFFLSSPNIRTLIKRNYLKIQDLIAKVGGLVKGLVLIVTIITFTYTQFSYTNYIYYIVQKNESNENNEKKEKLDNMKEDKSEEKLNDSTKKNNFINKLKNSQPEEKVVKNPNKNQFHPQIRSPFDLTNITFMDYIQGSLFGFIFKKKRELYTSYLRIINIALSFENLIKINIKYHKNNNIDDSYLYNKNKIS